MWMNHNSQSAIYLLSKLAITSLGPAALALCTSSTDGEPDDTAFQPHGSDTQAPVCLPSTSLTETAGVKILSYIFDAARVADWSGGHVGST